MLKLITLTTTLIISIWGATAQSLDKTIGDFHVQFELLENSKAELQHKADEVVEGQLFKYVSFQDKLSNADHLRLTEAGIQLLEYHGDGVYTASIPVRKNNGQLRSLKIEAQAIIADHHKAEQIVLQGQLPAHALRGNIAKLIIKFPKSITHHTIRELCAEHGIVVTVGNNHNNFLEVEVPATEISNIANLPFISSLEPVAPLPVADDKRGRSLHKVNRTNGRAGALRNYTGDGIAIQVRDDGAVFDHLDFYGRNNQDHVGESRGDHGDGVAGILCGAGNLDPVNEGMAPGAFMYVTDYRANFLDITLDLHLDNDVLVTNSSYSDGCNRGYSNNSETVDQQMFENPTYMHVFSAGNDGESDCQYGAGNVWGNITGGHKIGKNVIATANLNYRGELENSSSRGPASDGRIKPDISANGFGHESTAELQGYMTFGGTSAAAPVVAGVAALLQEAYLVNHGTVANAALLKAIMLNTATELGNKGPDFKFGWGSVNAHRSALVIEENRFIQGNLAQDQTIQHTFNVPAGTKQVKIMTYWPDREGSISATQDLLTDINTTLQNGSEVYMPWVLDHSPDPVLLDLPATKGEDHKNNMEQIAIDDPAAGEYVLSVSGDDVPFGSADYYIVWEYITDAIEITSPNGGENIAYNNREVIHWDAYGDHGSFLVELLDDNGEVLVTRSVSGTLRLAEMTMPSEYTQNAMVRVSRDGITDISDATFVISAYPSNVEVLKLDDINYLTWDTIPEALSYNIYRMGEKYMEKVAETDATSYAVPAGFNFVFTAVSANFPEGFVGERSRAIPGRAAPEAVIADFAETACLDQVYIISTPTLDTLVTYKWDFGAGATPDTAITAGPHEVIYSSRGQKVVQLTITHEGGTNGTGAILNVRDLPEGDEIMQVEDDQGIYTFSSNAKRVDDYLWDFGDGNTATGEEVTHGYETTGTFTVTMQGVGDCGMVEISKDLTVAVVSVAELTPDDFLISPNPNNGAFTITLPDLEGHQLELRLFSLDGKLVKSSTVANTKAGSQIRFDEQDLPSGIYQLSATFAKKNVVSKIVIK